MLKVTRCVNMSRAEYYSKNQILQRLPLAPARVESPCYTICNAAGQSPRHRLGGFGAAARNGHRIPGGGVVSKRSWSCGCAATGPVLGGTSYGRGGHRRTICRAGSCTGSVRCGVGSSASARGSGGTARQAPPCLGSVLYRRFWATSLPGSPALSGGGGSAEGGLTRYTAVPTTGL